MITISNQVVKGLTQLVQIPSFMFIGTTDIELREFEEKRKKNNNNMDKMLIGKGSGILVKYFIHSLTCSMLYSHQKSKLKIRTKFPNVWGEYKYHI